MNYSTPLFVFGIIVSALVPVLEEVVLFGSIDFNVILEWIFSFTPHFWKLGYSILVVVIMPCVIIPSIRKRFVENHMKLYSFLSGNTMGFAMLEIGTFVFSWENFNGLR